MIRFAATVLRGAWRVASVHLPGAGVTAASPPPTDGHRVVVALSTTPRRITRIAPAIASLIRQTRRPDAIVLALPSYSQRERRGYVVPRWLEEHPAVTILRADRDWGPATKLLPALAAERDAPETMIIAVDDDNVYPAEMVETFVRFSERFPDAALCFRGLAVPLSRAHRECRPVFGTQLSAAMPTDIVTGCGGVLVKPRFFDGEVFDYARAPEGAFYNDDIWFSAHLARRKVPRLIVPTTAPFVYFSTMTTIFGSAGLDRTHNRDHRHTDAVLRHFSELWGTATNR